MDILSTGIDKISSGQQILGKTAKTAQEDTGFGDLLKQAIGEVNNLQQQSSDMKTKMLTGEVQDLSQVTIASEKASLAFQLTLQIRNKVVEAYQEIMRMQV